jgi:hypothetical protein
MRRNMYSPNLVGCSSARRQESRSLRRSRAATFAFAIILPALACSDPYDPATQSAAPVDHTVAASASMSPALIAHGQTIFRFDTFGDETFWTDTLRMHEVIRTSVSPKAALGLGLKVDADALPPSVKAGIQHGTIDLDAPATTVALLELGANELSTVE